MWAVVAMRCGSMEETKGSSHIPCKGKWRIGQRNCPICDRSKFLPVQMEDDQLHLLVMVMPLPRQAVISFTTVHYGSSYVSVNPLYSETAEG